MRVTRQRARDAACAIGSHEEGLPAPQHSTDREEKIGILRE